MTDEKDFNKHIKVLTDEEVDEMIYEARLTAERDRLAKNRWDIQEGKARGRAEAKAEIICMMLESMSVEDVAKVLKMTPHEVRDLASLEGWRSVSEFCEKTIGEDVL